MELELLVLSASVSGIIGSVAPPGCDSAIRRAVCAADPRG